MADQPVLTKGVVLEWVRETIAWWRVADLDKDLGIATPAGKTARRQILHRLVTEGALEKHGSHEGLYRLILQGFTTLDLDANAENVLDLKWPTDATGKGFGLQYARVYPKSIVTVAGVKNLGKTTFCLNFVMANLDWPAGLENDKPHCVYHTNELASEELSGRLRAFDWVNWRNGTGRPKFLAVERFDAWQDVVRQFPDSLHIIDYLDPGEEAFRIGPIIDQIRQQLGKGMALIAIQKRQSTGTRRDGTTYRQYVDYGVGGQYSEHRARVVIHLNENERRQNELLIKSCKSWREKNLNGRKFLFKIEKDGSRFADIREITTEYGEGPRF